MLKIYINNKPGKKIQASMSYYKQLRLTKFIADIQIYSYKMLKIYLKMKPGKKIQSNIISDTQCCIKQLGITRFIADI